MTLKSRHAAVVKRRVRVNNCDDCWREIDDDPPLFFGTWRFAGRDWKWIEADATCRKFTPQVDCLEKIYPWVRDFSFVLQAGGCLGVWPYFLAQRFASVMTFEPDAANFECLKANIPGNVTAYQGALGPWPSCALTLPTSDPVNISGYYVLRDGQVPMYAVDDLDIESCGLIYLDVEGFELEVLQSAERTVARCRPVIVTEYKPLPQQPLPQRIDPLMAEYGYEKAGEVYKDVIWLPSGAR